MFQIIPHSHASLLLLVHFLVPGSIFRCKIIPFARGVLIFVRSVKPKVSMLFFPFTKNWQRVRLGLLNCEAAKKSQTPSTPMACTNSTHSSDPPSSNTVSMWTEPFFQLSADSWSLYTSLYKSELVFQSWRRWEAGMNHLFRHPN